MNLHSLAAYMRVDFGFNLPTSHIEMQHMIAGENSQYDPHLYRTGFDQSPRLSERG